MDNLSKLAREGVNILSVSSTGKYVYYIYEYSWKDPTMRDKLHWSKAILRSDDNNSMTKILEHILRAVTEIRKELEGDAE